MTIETKYNIGNIVWMYVLNEPTEVVITKVKTLSHSKFNTNVSYRIKCVDEDYEVEISEKYLYKTKEELLNSN